MGKKRDDYYFLGFIRLVEFSNQAAELLRDIINNYDHTKLSELKDKMHYIEHSADLEKHLLIEKLAKEFITPIEREDIIDIAQKIDDVTDAIEDVLIRLYMYDVKEINQNLREFADVICSCCQALTNTVNEFANFKRSNTLKDAIIAVNNFEEVGDRLYITSVHELFTSNLDTRDLIVWEVLYDLVEKCCDSCENVADAIETVIMKNK